VVSLEGRPWVFLLDDLLVRVHVGLLPLNGDAMSTAVSESWGFSGQPAAPAGRGGLG